MALATVHGGGPEQGEAQRVGGGAPGALGVEAHGSLAGGPWTPADGRVVLHERLPHGRGEESRCYQKR